MQPINRAQEPIMQIKSKSGNHPRRTTRRARLSTAILAALITPLAEPVLAGRMVEYTKPPQSAQVGTQSDTPAVGQVVGLPKIQVAIVLDTSNSMDGLIDQTRNQLWQVVNEFSAARRNGVTPILEIAVFEYGNDANASQEGYVRMLNGFTRELDAVSAGLFSLTTNGGSEYCGFAIEKAVESLQWSQSDGDIKTILIAGNESFAQGPVDYREAVRMADRQGISINTIHAGGYEEGVDDQWQSGAVLAGGDYMSIDANQQVVHIAAPQDDKIAELNFRLNQTYLPYGDAGAASANRQMEQDSLSSGISSGLLAKRAKSKVSSFYNNANWDLVDALQEGKLDEAELERMDDDQLPVPMLGMSAREKLDYVQQRKLERDRIKQEITALSESRAAHVAAHKRAQLAAPSMGDALTNAIKKQAQQKNFTFAE